MPEDDEKPEPLTDEAFARELKAVRDMLSRRVPEGFSLVDELLAARRREVEEDERQTREWLNRSGERTED